MSEHMPQHHPNPAHPINSDASGIDPALIDLVAGDPPVPITVWRTARTSTDAAGVGARLAYRLVAAYSRPGDAVVDLTHGHALTAACTAGRRRHHPAWFTDTASLIIGPATPTDDTAAAPGDGELPDLRAWFGDDLTDPDLPPAAEPADRLPHGAPVQAATSLAVATWPLDAGDAANRVKLAWLLAACARLLWSGGCLVLVVTASSGTVTTPEDFGPVAAAAAGAGLGYLQHIVAVAADTSAEGDAFVYHLTDEELLALAADSAGPLRGAVAHLRVHADLLVFSQAQFSDQPRRARRRGGGRCG
jgi:hypothetical protein